MAADPPLRAIHAARDPETDGLRYDAWSPAPDGDRYAGQLTVLFDPAEHGSVMEQDDLLRHRFHSDVPLDRGITLGATAVALAALSPWLFFDLEPRRRRSRRSGR